ncbi:MULTISPECIES: homoserine O-acetyltransferase [Rhodomicrobium]|uniref:E22 family MetX-like putative esterase n=1 Tax=Rhodomicrobium TaxID=1068 RepID=UPI000B4AB601|nr:MULTISPECIES: homoserine O-acetyltransferase [Rhodomicrobium]
MKAILSVVLVMTGLAAGSARAQDLMTQKKTFGPFDFTTQSGRELKGVKVGWESYGTLNADKSNAILICHYFSGSSHAAGKYAAADPAPGYWDAIIGPGKAIDTNRYYVLSSDTLVNLGANDPAVITTGPASIDPLTNKPYAMDFPIVTIRDFVEVQKRLVESLGISRLVMVAGPSMGSLQTYEWAASYPDMVGKIMPVIGALDTDANLVAWLDVWATPIRLDPKWQNGNYYGGEPPLAGLAESLKVITLQANHWRWANKSFAGPAGAKWAREGEDPAKSFANQYQVEQALADAGAARAKTSDANHLLYLIKANQLFAGGDAKAKLSRIKAPALIIYQPEDQVFQAAFVESTARMLAANGVKVETVQLKGDRGHLDGVLTIKQAEAAVAAFLAR